MTDLEIVELLSRKCSDLEKAMEFSKAFKAIKDAAQPSALNIKPATPRKKREARKPATPAADLINGHSTETAQ